MCENCNVANGPEMKVVVLLSGGIDSSTLLAAGVNEHGAHNVIALSLFYGQKHEREILSARKIAEHYCVQHIEKDITDVFTFSNSALLGKSTEEVPDGSYADDSTHEADGMSKTYVPYRNGLFLSYAAAIAYSIGAGEVYYGAHADDAAGNAYPDCSVDFYEAQNKAIFEGTGKKVSMVAPLIDMFKKDVVEWGLELSVPYAKTWSCYKGEGKACGTCGTCVDRRIAFIANGVRDPLEYANPLPATMGVHGVLKDLGYTDEDINVIIHE